MQRRQRGQVIKRRKKYRHLRDPRTGKRLLAHRVLAERMLGRPLLPREVVHHRDGDGTNNACENLLVLPSQRYHAHLEFHLRRERLGMPSLFPELLQGIRLPPQGSLFESLLFLQVHEPPLPVRKGAPEPPLRTGGESLFPVGEQPTQAVPSLTLIQAGHACAPGPQALGDLLAQLQIRVVERQRVTLMPLSAFRSRD